MRKGINIIYYHINEIFMSSESKVINIDREIDFLTAEVIIKK